MHGLTTIAIVLKYFGMVDVCRSPYDVTLPRWPCEGTLATHVFRFVLTVPCCTTIHVFLILRCYSDSTKSTSKCLCLTLSCEGYCTPWLYCSTQHPSHAPTMWSITKRVASTPVHDNCTSGWTFNASLLQNKSCRPFFQLSAFACKTPLHKIALRSKCWRPLAELSSHVNNMRRPFNKNLSPSRQAQLTVGAWWQNAPDTRNTNITITRMVMFIDLVRIPSIWKNDHPIWTASSSIQRPR